MNNFAAIFRLKLPTITVVQEDSVGIESLLFIPSSYCRFGNRIETILVKQEEK
jgi:hypothetical protein